MEFTSENKYLPAKKLNLPAKKSNLPAKQKIPNTHQTP
jgi:hypothetical protein